MTGTCDRQGLSGTLQIIKFISISTCKIWFWNRIILSLAKNYLKTTGIVSLATLLSTCCLLKMSLEGAWSDEHSACLPSPHKGSCLQVPLALREVPAPTAALSV